MIPMLVDTHAHLCDAALWGERFRILEDAAQVGVRALVGVGYDRATSERAIELGAARIEAGPTVGIHPTSILKATEEDFESVARLAATPDVVGIGETGLDFFWDSASPERQREVFRWHLSLAAQHSLPVTVHSRAAEKAVVGEIQGYGSVSGALHCFNGDQETAARAMDAGLFLGVGGQITFKNAADLQELVRWLPLDRLLLETDSPYLSPQPFRGKRNEPARLTLIALKVAELKGLTVEEVAAITTRNAFTLFPRLKVRWESRPSLPASNADVSAAGEKRLTHTAQAAGSRSAPKPY